MAAASDGEKETVFASEIYSLDNVRDAGALRDERRPLVDQARSRPGVAPVIALTGLSPTRAPRNRPPNNSSALRIHLSGSAIEWS